MKDTEYAYAVAYIKTLENKMLTASDLDNLINAPDIDSMIKILADKGFFVGEKNDLSPDMIFKYALMKAWDQARECSPEGAPFDVLLYKNDFHNLKTVLKALVSGSSWEELVLEPAVVEPDMLYNAVKEKKFADLPPFLAEPAQNGYKIITTTGDGQAAEVYLDCALWEKIIERAEKEKNDILTDWININVSVANMKTAYRAAGKSPAFIKNAMIKDKKGEWEKLYNAALSGKDAVKDMIAQIGYKDASEALSVSYSEFEKWCDNKIMAAIKKAKFKSFGFEPILGYLTGVEAQIRSLRIIFAGKQNGVKKEIIRERLRELYV